MAGSIKKEDTNTNGKISNILIVDDHPLVRIALRNLIDKHQDMKVIGEASDGKEAIILTEKLQPNVVIMDIGMPIMNGLEATRQIKIHWPNIAILVLTVYSDKEHILGILEAGAAGYLTKETFGNDIILAIRAIASGDSILSSSILKEILESTTLETNYISTTKYNNLTSRDKTLLKLIARGLGNKQIAAEMSIGEATVKSYLADIFLKMEVSSRTEAVVSALKAGVVKFSELG